MSGPLRIVVLVLSDRAAAGERADASSPALAGFLAERGQPAPALEILPDDRAAIAARLAALADGGACDLLLTCGGTGLAPRDLTPEATLAVGEREIPGLGERMRAAGLAHSARAILSRGTAVQRGRTLILNLPGSPRAALQSLAAVWEVLPHAVAKLQGDPADCGD